MLCFLNYLQVIYEVDALAEGEETPAVSTEEDSTLVASRASSQSTLRPEGEGENSGAGGGHTQAQQQVNFCSREKI